MGLDPGSVLEWDQEGGRVAIRREVRYSSEDLHRALFPRGPPKPKMLDEMTAGKGDHRHLGADEAEEAYPFASLDRLIVDFKRDCEEFGWRWPK